MRPAFFVALFWLGVVGLILASLIPNVSLPITTVDVGITIRISKEMLAHFLGFLLLAWLYAKAYGFSAGAVVVMLLLAVGSEAIQHFFTAGRNVEVGDLACNVLGALAGLLVVRLGVGGGR